MRDRNGWVQAASPKSMKRWPTRSRSGGRPQRRPHCRPPRDPQRASRPWSESAAAAQIATLATGGYIDAGEPIVLLGDSGTGKSTPAHRARPGRLGTRQTSPLRSPLPSSSTNSSKRPTNASCPASSAATDVSTYSCWMNLATSRSTPAGPNCCSRSSPSAKNGPARASEQTCRSANVEPSSLKRRVPGCGGCGGHEAAVECGLDQRANYAEPPGTGRRAFLRPIRRSVGRVGRESSTRRCGHRPGGRPPLPAVRRRWRTVRHPAFHTRRPVAPDRLSRVTRICRKWSPAEWCTDLPVSVSR